MQYAPMNLHTATQRLRARPARSAAAVAALIASALARGVVLVLALALISGAAQAQPAPGGGHPPRPPAEALDACKSLKAGAACGFQLPDRSVTGSCWAPEGKPLACRPKDAPPPGDRPSTPPKTP